MQLVYQILADVVVAAHFAYVMFVILGLLAVLIGRIFQWEWTRRFWFRVIHLAMILIVVVESWFGVVCPLTTWENSLRKLAGQTTYNGAFIAQWIHDVLFVEASPAVLTTCYTVFGLAVLASFIVSPPRWPKRAQPADAAA
ncbi:MAG: DUF2784 domain-containing protein [Planctomycetaceae bacterium]